MFLERFYKIFKVASCESIKINRTWKGKGDLYRSCCVYSLICCYCNTRDDSFLQDIFCVKRWILINVKATWRFRQGFLNYIYLTT